MYAIFSDRTNILLYIFLLKFSISDDGLLKNLIDFLKNLSYF